MPAGSSGNDAISAARFSLTIDGVEIAGFSELVGIDSRAEAEDLAALLAKKLPGTRNPPTVTLRRALTGDMQMSAWHETAVDGEPRDAQRSATLVVYGTEGTPAAKYHLESAWPSTLRTGSLEGGGSDLYETVTLTCTKVERVAP